jgi:hypothetical protein
MNHCGKFMNFLGRLFGSFNKPAESIQNIQNEGPKDFYNTKIDRYNAMADDAWFTILIENENNVHRELIIPIPLSDFRDMVHANIAPHIEHFGIQRWGKTESISSELKQQLFEAINQNGNTLHLEGKTWKILQNRNGPRRG